VKPETEAMLRGAIRMAAHTREASAVAAAIVTALELEGLAPEAVPPPPPSKDAIRMREKRSHSANNTHELGPPKPDPERAHSAHSSNSAHSAHSANAGGVGGGLPPDQRSCEVLLEPGSLHTPQEGTPRSHSSNSAHSAHSANGSANGTNGTVADLPANTAADGMFGVIASAWADGVRTECKASYYPEPRGKAARTLTVALRADREARCPDMDPIEHATQSGTAFVKAFPDRQEYSSLDFERWLGSGAKTRPGIGRKGTLVQKTRARAGLDFEVGRKE